MEKPLIKLIPDFIKSHIAERHDLKKAIINSWWLLLEKIFRSIINLFVIIWIGRYLGPEQYGLYNYVFAYIVIFTSIASMGIDGIVIRELVKKPGLKDIIIGSAFFIKISGGILALILSAVVTFFLELDNIQLRYFILIISAGFVFQAFDVVDSWFQSRVESKFIVYSKSAALALISISRIILILSKASLRFFIIAGLIEMILYAAGFMITYLIRGNSIRKWKINSGKVKEIINESWPLIISGIMVAVFFRIDQIMLGRMGSFHDVGIYNSALKISEFFNLVPLIILPSIYPAMIRYRELNDKKFNYMIEKITAIMFTVSIIILVFTAVLSKTIVTLFFGSSYSNASIPLIILSAASIFNFSAALRIQVFFIKKLTIYNIYCGAIGVLCIVLLNYLLIPRIGVTGAAAANLISVFISGFASSFLFGRLRHLGVLQLRGFVFFWKYLNFRMDKT